MSHPPVNILWNWCLIQITNDNRTLIAIVLGAMAWTGVFPLYLIGRELYNREIGYYMAGLYTVLPGVLIVNHISLDGLIAAFLAWAMAFMILGCRREGHGYMLLAGLAVGGFAMAHYITPIIMPALFILALFGLRDLGKTKQGFFAYSKAALFKVLLFAIGVGLPFLLVEMATDWKFDYPKMMTYIMFSAHKQAIGSHPWYIGGWLAWVNYFLYAGAVLTALYMVRWLEILHGDWRHDILPWAGFITILVPVVMLVARQETERAYMLLNIFLVTTAAPLLWRGRIPFRYMIRPVATAGAGEEGGGWRGLFFTVMALSFINAVVVQLLAVDHW